MCFFFERDGWDKVCCVIKLNKDCDGDYCYICLKVMRIYEVLFYEYFLSNFIDFLIGSCCENY